MKEKMKTKLMSIAAVTVTLTLLATAAQAIPIWQYDRLSWHDQYRYFNALEQSIRDATQGYPTLNTQFTEFFRSGPTGGGGLRKFDFALAHSRIADLQAAAKNPKMPRLEVETVLYLTLIRNGITFPKGFKVPPRIRFTPEDPLERERTMDDAQRMLAHLKSGRPPGTTSIPSVSSMDSIPEMLRAAGRMTPEAWDELEKNQDKNRDQATIDELRRIGGIDSTKRDRFGMPCYLSWDKSCRY